MGWTGLHRPKGTTDRDFFAAEFGENFKFLATSSSPTAFYAATENLKTGEIFAAICLKRWSRGDYFNFHYKEMDETCGPNETGAPAKILDLLTPTDSEYANGWREKCRARLAAEAAKPKAKPGDTIRFAKPIEFTDGSSFTELRLEKRSTFADPYALWRRFRIPSWRKLDYEIAEI